jgi:4-amino-4-deoxy-L-arabinose transferase-like glycosyltransferase
MKKYFWLIFSLFFISRFFFLANYPHFYDSPEYLRESLSSSFFNSLSSSHEVVHPVWLFLTQLFQKITSQPTSWELSLISAIFGLISMVVFYFLIKRIFNEKIAVFSSIPLIFFPHSWLIQTNILHESLDFGLFLSSLLFFDFFLKKRRLYWWVLSVLLLSLTALDFVGILFWSIAFLGLAILRSKENDWKKNIAWGFLTIFLSLILSFVVLYFLLLLTKNIEPISRLKVIFLGFGATGIFSGWGLIDILRILRNNLYTLVYGYSVAAILGLIFSSVYLYKKRKWAVLIFLFSFFVPFLITGKFWHFGPFGRLAGLMAYPLALFLALMPWRKIYWLLVTIIFLTFCPTFWVYQKTPVPQIQAGLISKIETKEKDLLIFSDYQRPQLNYDNALYIHSNEKIEKEVEEKITKNLLTGNRVFISQQAIDFPYWQYDGQQIHIISKGNKSKAQLKEFLEDKKLNLIVEEKNYPLLNVYQLSLQTE